MPRRVRLPEPLIARPFSTAEAHAFGIGEGRLRGRDLQRPFHATRSTRTATTLQDRCVDYLPVIADGFFSHSTAARLWGVPLATEFGTDELLHVSTHWPRRAPRGRGVAGHALRHAMVAERQGLPTTTAVRTWLTLATALPWRELVVAADHLVLDPFVLDPRDIRPYAHAEELSRALSRYSGRGAARAAEALRWVRQGAESRPETLLRILILSAGLPEPSLQVDIEGARVDMFYERWRTVVAYDGEQHRTDSAQYDKDALHLDRLYAADYNVVRVRSRGLFRQPERTVVRVAEALRRGGWEG